MIRGAGLLNELKEEAHPMKVTANGIEIHYRLDGPAGAPVVVMSHSLAAHVGMWEDQLPILSDYRVLRYDTRGHGGTDAPEGEYTLGQLAGDLLGLLDALRVEKAHFVGLSMGGMVGQTAALRDPGRFLTLSLCDTSSRVPPEGRALWSERIAAARSGGMESLVASTIDRWFSAGFQAAAPERVERVREMIRATPVAGYCGCCAAIRDLDVTERLAEIRVPTLLVVGEHDPGTPVAAHEVIRDRVEGARLVVIDDALHFTNVERTDAFNAALGGFLAEHRAAP